VTTATRTLILGGGLAGVSAAYHAPKNSTLLVERESDVGGTARSFRIGGFTFDFTGHLLHLHNPYTKKLIPRLLKNDFYRCQRDTWIFSKGVYTRYPFQAFTHGLPADVVNECVLGFAERYLENLPPEKRSRNFRRWCFEVFGDGIARHFMIPYNEKLYQTSAGNLTTDWCGPFVPTPDLADVIAGALGTKDPRTFGYNATFLYPRKGGIQALPAAMARNLSGIRTGVSVTSVDWRARAARLSTGETVSYRNLINTIPLPELLARMRPLPAPVARAARQLKWASILCVNIGVRRPKISEKSWIYFPEDEFPFYRVGFPMNFTPHVVPRGCSSMYVEVPMKRAAGKSRAALLREIRSGLERAEILKKSDRLPVVQFLPIRYAYVIYDQRRAPALKVIGAFLRKNRIQTIGRYGAWKYSFMEEAILDGRKAAEALPKSA
jgi:protoporphyrinogen oxidase